MQLLISLFLWTVGPVCGAFVERSWGGKGALGGVLGGVCSYCGFGVAMELIMYLNPQSGFFDVLGPVPDFFVLAVSGALVGWNVGILVFIVMRTRDSFGET